MLHHISIQTLVRAQSRTALLHLMRFGFEKFHISPEARKREARPERPSGVGTVHGWLVGLKEATSVRREI